ncbi:MAG: hypothetical protein ABIE36_03090 [Candidatus Diapherotrites archaeon]
MKRGEICKEIEVKRKGQVWIETVIYLLIAFVMIGLVLSFIRPKIEEVRDKAIIEQSLELMKDVENLMLIEIGSPGNKRLIELNIKKGSLIIDGKEDRVLFEIESRYVYSEPGQEVQVGNIVALTEVKGEYNLVTLERDFSDSYNLTYKNEDILKTLSKASIPYKLYITNNGELNNKITMNFDL